MAVTDDLNTLKVKTYSQAGPASYATGGFALDASADFSWLGFVDVVLTTRGTLGACDYEVDLNVDTSGAEAFGKAVVKVVREVYDKATVGDVSGNPAGTTVQTAKAAAASTSGSSHTHTIDHNHPSATSGAMTEGGGGNNAGAGANLSAHTHTVDIANFTGSSTAATHTHDRSFEYEHDHAVSAPTTTDVAATEVAATTDLSGTTFLLTVYGFGKS